MPALTATGASSLDEMMTLDLRKPGSDIIRMTSAVATALMR